MTSIVTESSSWRLDHMEQSVAHTRRMAEHMDNVQLMPDEIVEVVTVGRQVVPTPIITVRPHYSFFHCPRCVARYGSRLAYMAHYVDEHLEKLK